MRRLLVAIFVLALVAGGSFALWRQGLLDNVVPRITAMVKPAAKPAGSEAARPRQPAASPVEIAAAKRMTISDDITAVGTLQSDESAQIASETSGRIAEILFKEGDRVEAGDVLVRLDDALIAAQLADAQARLALARANYERASTLRKSGNTAQSTLDTAKTELAVAQSALDLVKAQQEKLSIKAPFPGELGFRVVSPGAYVTAGTALVNLEKIDRLKAVFSAPEIYLQKLEVGQTIEVRADALPGKTFEGTIYAIDPAIDINGRAIRLRAMLDNAAGELRPGLLARITVKGVPRSAVTIPESALVPRGNDLLVYRADNGKALETKVLAGRRDSGFVEIIEGVEDGQQVVTAGQQRLRDGASVEVVPSTAPATEG